MHTYYTKASTQWNTKQAKRETANKFARSSIRHLLLWCRCRHRRAEFIITTNRNDLMGGCMQQVRSQRDFRIRSHNIVCALYWHKVIVAFVISKQISWLSQWHTAQNTAFHHLMVLHLFAMMLCIAVEIAIERLINYIIQFIWLKRNKAVLNISKTISTIIQLSHFAFMLPILYAFRFYLSNYCIQWYNWCELLLLLLFFFFECMQVKFLHGLDNRI